MSDPIVIVSVARTPMGGMLGSLLLLALVQMRRVLARAVVVVRWRWRRATCGTAHGTRSPFLSWP